MIFVDTSAWVALADRRDRDHADVLESYRRIARGEFGKPVTTNYVMTETLTIVHRRLGGEKTRALAKAIGDSKEVRMLWVEPVHHAEAVRLLLERDDTTWSVVDCSSFVVMRALGISQALSLDADFRHAGFEVLP